MRRLARGLFDIAIVAVIIRAAWVTWWERNVAPAGCDCG